MSNDRELRRLERRIDNLESAAELRKIVIGVLTLTQIVWVALAVVLIVKAFGIRLSVDDGAPVPTEAAAPLPLPPPPPPDAKTLPAEPAEPAEPTDTPAAEPATEATPTAVPMAGLRSHIDRGWAHISSGELASAERSFAAALAIEPFDPDANYGHGYALIRLGNTDGAREALCTARRLSGDVELDREINSELRKNDLSC